MFPDLADQLLDPKRLPEQRNSTIKQ